MECKVCKREFEEIPKGSCVSVNEKGKILFIIACAECWFDACQDIMDEIHVLTPNGKVEQVQ